jgi:hypothetical protein
MKKECDTTYEDYLSKHTSSSPIPTYLKKLSMNSYIRKGHMVPGFGQLLGDLLSSLQNLAWKMIKLEKMKWHVIEFSTW